MKKKTCINFIKIKNGSSNKLEKYTIKPYEVTHGNISDCYGYILEKNNCNISHKNEEK